MLRLAHGLTFEVSELGELTIRTSNTFYRYDSRSALAIALFLQEWFRDGDSR